MNLLRLLIILALAWFAYRAIKRLLKAANARQVARRPVSAETVRCHHCGVYVPKSTATSTRGKWYCEQHRLERDE